MITGPFELPSAHSGTFRFLLATVLLGPRAVLAAYPFLAGWAAQYPPPQPAPQPLPQQELHGPPVQCPHRSHGSQQSGGSLWKSLQ